MSNLATKLQQEQKRKTIKQAKRKKEKRFRITLGEKILGGIFCIGVCFFAVQIVSNQVTIYEMNKNIQKTEVAIAEKKRVNNDLEVQVNEYKNYDRILKKAKELGLKLNQNNVKVVQE